jgi:hypothetical protein
MPQLTLECVAQAVQAWAEWKSVAQQVLVEAGSMTGAISNPLRWLSSAIGKALDSDLGSAGSGFCKEKNGGGPSVFGSEGMKYVPMAKRGKKGA